MLIVTSILLSLAIVGLGVWEGRRWFGAYHDSAERLTVFADKIGSCSEGVSFMEVARGWVKDDDAATRSLARNLLRHFEKEPIQVKKGNGWVVDIDELCNGKRLFKSHPAAVRVEAMPGLLMGAGILFTFLGLTIGVFGLDPTDADQLTLGVKKLLGGMSMAFLTSIAGIGTSLWWSWRAREMGARIEAVYNHIAEVLHDRTFILLPEEMNYQFLADMRTQARALENLEEVMVNSFRRALVESIFADFKQLLELTVSQSDTNKHLGSALKDIHHELKGISQNFAQQADNQRLMGKALKRILQQREEVSKANAMSPDQQTRFVADSIKLAEGFRNIHQGQDGAVQALADTAEEIKKLIQTARIANADVIKIHKVMVKHLGNLEAYWEGYRGQMEQMQQTLNQTLEGFQGDLSRSLEKVHGEFDELLAKGLNHFAGALKEFQNTLKGLTSLIQQEERKPKSWLGK